MVKLTLFCTVANLKVPVMTVYDMAAKVLDTYFLSIPDLGHYICFVQSGVAFTVKGNNRAHINNNHTQIIIYNIYIYILDR